MFFGTDYFIVSSSGCGTKRAASRDRLASWMLSLLAPSAFGWSSEDADPAPESTTCPITYDVMRDPVLASDGNTYERAAIQQSMDSGNHRSPLTNLRFANQTLTPNLYAKSRIAEWEQNNKGKSGLEKTISKQLAQLFISESPQDASEALEKIITLVSKYEIFMPFLS